MKRAAFGNVSTLSCGVYSRAAFINISALNCGVYSREAFNRINTVFNCTVCISKFYFYFSQHCNNFLCHSVLVNQYVPILFTVAVDLW